MRPSRLFIHSLLRRRGPGGSVAGGAPHRHRHETSGGLPDGVARASLAADIIDDMDSSSIIDRASQACADVFCGTPVFLAYAYGSRIEGGETPASDLDIGYYLTTLGSLPLADEMILADRLSQRLGMDVDLRNLGPAPLEWRARVLERGRRLHCTDETARVALERELMVRWFDEKPRIERLHATRLASFAAAGLAAEPTR